MSGPNTDKAAAVMPAIEALEAEIAARIATVRSLREFAGLPPRDEASATLALPAPAAPPAGPVKRAKRPRKGAGKRSRKSPARRQRAGSPPPAEPTGDNRPAGSGDPADLLDGERAALVAAIACLRDDERISGRAVARRCGGLHYTEGNRRLRWLVAKGFMHAKGAGAGRVWTVLRNPDGSPFADPRAVPPGATVTEEDGIRVTKLPPGRAAGTVPSHEMDGVDL